MKAPSAFGRQKEMNKHEGSKSSHVCNNRDCLEEYCEPVWDPENCIGYCEGTKCNWRYAEPKEGNGDT